MPRCRRPTPRLYLHLRQILILTLTRRFILLIACVSFLSLIWIQFDSSDQQPIAENFVKEAIENAKKDARYSEVYRKTSRLPKGMKYILLWTDKTYNPFPLFGEGQRMFIEQNCSVINCYVTSDRNFLKDTTEFDAIAFNGRNLKKLELPERRSAHQKYIYVNMESADNYPVCGHQFDGFFNWTATYRLDSDVPSPYITVKKYGQVIGPKKNMKWPVFPEVSEEFAEKFSNKSKAAAWFVSSCFYSRSKRTKMANRLAKALEAYKHKLDVYGGCGPLKCPLAKKDICDSFLERDYYFYLSLENSFDKDYVTEKVLTALQHDVVPIVFGGADYSRFLPPNSYIDARNYSAIILAARLVSIISDPKLYREFFRWKGHLTFTDPSRTTNVCDVCTALNSAKAKDFSVYEKFREWWHPYYVTRCSDWKMTKDEKVYVMDTRKRLS